jgi:hypothetical protein
MRRGWGGQPVRQEEAKGILLAALGMLATHFGYSEARRASWWSGPNHTPYACADVDCYVLTLEKQVGRRIL